MRALRLVLASQLFVLSTACGNVGLDALNSDTGALSAGAVLEIVPTGEIYFGEHSPDSPSAFQDITLKSTGDSQIAIIDVYLDDMTSQAFQFASDDLPLPLRLQPGKDFPVTVSFSPYAVGQFTGTFVVELDEGGDPAEHTRPLRGDGCPPDRPDCE